MIAEGGNKTQQDQQQRAQAPGEIHWQPPSSFRDEHGNELTPEVARFVANVRDHHYGELLMAKFEQEAREMEAARLAAGGESVDDWQPPVNDDCDDDSEEDDDDHDGEE